MWIFEQIDKRGDGFEYIEGWQDPELGGDPEDVVVLDGGESVVHLDDPVSTLQLVAMLLIDSIPGLEEEDSSWDLDLDETSAG